MKDLARVGYDVFADSFDVNLTRGTIRNGGSFDEKNGKAVRDRWKLVAEAIIKAHHENLIAQGLAIVDLKTPEVLRPAHTLPLESETFECEDCGAKLMKGENHDCAKVHFERRRLGHHLPKDLK